MFFLRHPGGILYTLEAGSASPTEISRVPFPFVGRESTLLPGGRSVIGMGTTARDGFPRGLRRLSLAEGGELSTLREDPDISSYVFDTQASPDGEVLAIAAVNWVPSRITLMQMNLATREVEQLWVAAGTDEEQEFTRFSWLPDRSALVGQLWGVGRFRMARFNLATRTMTILSDWMTADMLTPTMRVSRDGRVIAYNGQDRLLRFITMDGAPAPGFPTDLRGIYPAFSPDGKLLAYSKFQDGIAGIDGIFIYRFSDGATWRLLPEGTLIEQVLDWE